MKKYDVCVIGGGPAGYAAAMRAIDFGKKILLIEKNTLGGAGVLNGALASKTMWELSRAAKINHSRLKKYPGSPYQIDYKDVVKEVEEAVNERITQLSDHLHALQSLALAHPFEIMVGQATLNHPHEVLVIKDDGNEMIYAENIILATGSRPRLLPQIPIDEHNIVTSDGVLNFEEFPKSLVILGAGVIGCEYATIFSNFGKTKVYLISKEDRILPFEDTDISEAIEKNFIENGVVVHKNADLREMKYDNGLVKYEICINNDRCEWFEVEKALISVGRVPNLEQLGIGELGINLNKRGYIDDDDTKTNLSHIYAVGDLTADIALVNVGELEGRHAIEKICDAKTKPLRYDNISTIMFLNPETASVGLNETQAIAKNLDFRVVTLDYTTIPRAIAMRNTQGFFKILVTDNADMKVLGMRALGEHASSAIQAVALLISMDKGIEELAEIIHPHPSIIEGIQECMRILLGKSIFKPAAIKDHMKVRVYRNGQYFEYIPTPLF